MPNYLDKTYKQVLIIGSCPKKPGQGTEVLRCAGRGVPLGVMSGAGTGGAHPVLGEYPGAPCGALKEKASGPEILSLRRGGRGAAGPKEVETYWGAPDVWIQACTAPRTCAPCEGACWLLLQPKATDPCAQARNAGSRPCAASAACSKLDAPPGVSRRPL